MPPGSPTGEETLESGVGTAGTWAGSSTTGFLDDVGAGSGGCGCSGSGECNCNSGSQGGIGGGLGYDTADDGFALLHSPSFGEMMAGGNGQAMAGGGFEGQPANQGFEHGTDTSTEENYPCQNKKPTCCCCAEDLELTVFTKDRGVALAPTRTGPKQLGTDFDVIATLRHKGSGKIKPCRVLWCEMSDRDEKLRAGPVRKSGVWYDAEKDALEATTAPTTTAYIDFIIRTIQGAKTKKERDDLIKSVRHSTFGNYWMYKEGKTEAKCPGPHRVRMPDSPNMSMADCLKGKGVKVQFKIYVCSNCDPKSDKECKHEALWLDCELSIKCKIENKKPILVAKESHFKCFGKYGKKFKGKPTKCPKGCPQPKKGGEK